MSDYYKTLGVDRGASPEQIKQAYRRAAAKHHPDRGGSKEEFQKIEEAYRNLSDPQLRQQYDNPNPFGSGGNPFGDFPGGFSFHFGGTGNPFEDIFNQFARHQGAQPRQRIYTVAINVTLEQVATGSTEAIQLQTPTGPRAFQIKIPQGIEDGQEVRYDGLMPDGILQICFRILHHTKFQRRGLDLHSTVQVPLWDLLLGTTIRWKTIWGDEVDVTVPPRTNSGTTLRVSGKGLVNGHQVGNQYLLISSIMPDTISQQLLDLISSERTKK